MKSVSPNPEPLTRLSDENNFQKTKIENVSGNNERKTTNIPIKGKIKQDNNSKVNKSNWLSF